MNVSVNKLMHVVAAARHGGFSRAAESLNLTQPALSRSIAAIEAHYGLKIFERGAAGAVLTPAGADLVAEAEAVIRKMKDFDERFQLVGKGEIGRVAVGVGSTLAGMAIPRIAKFAFQNRQGIEVITLVRTANLLTKFLLDRDIDFFIAPYTGRELHSSIDIMTIGEVHILLVAHSLHPFWEGDTRTVTELAKFPIVSPAKVGWLNVESEGPGLLICEDYNVIRNLIINDGFIGYVPEEYIKNDIDCGTLRAISTDIPIVSKFPVALYHAKGRTLSPFCMKIIDALRLW